MLQKEQNDFRRQQLKYLGLEVLFENWENVLKSAIQKKPSFSTFLAGIIENEYSHKTEKARGDRTEEVVIRTLSTYELLVIDELGYESCNKLQTSLFFDLIRRRHRLYPTIITTQLGFDEWGSFLQDTHMAAALLDRITVNCVVFNMKDCISIRSKNIVYAVKKE